jgi:cytochrome c peroxidase
MSRQRAPWLVLVAALSLGQASGQGRPFPATSGEDAAERVELGRLLFFDPVLSRDGSLSCAHCHRPDRGLSDGLPTARGLHGARLTRNTPTLYNAALKPRSMWDRRAASLEEQALLPLLDPAELAADPPRLLARLAAIPEYARRFGSAFPGETSPISLASVARSLAAFERTLISRASRFDRYAEGERGALSAGERRGLALFRSLSTRCFECHRLPTFDAPLALSIGVPSADPGVGAISGEDAQRGFFGVPTLRNVARTAPYMHDGSLATLEAVVDFYRRGGGLARGVPAARLHEFIRPIELSDAEATDLVAFLRSLTDESARPAVPERVPSGLPVMAGLAP